MQLHRDRVAAAIGTLDNEKKVLIKLSRVRRERSMKELIFIKAILEEEAIKENLNVDIVANNLIQTDRSIQLGEKYVNSVADVITSQQCVVKESMWILCRKQKHTFWEP